MTSFEHSLQNRSFTSTVALAQMDRHGREVLLVVSKLALRFGAGTMRLAVRPIRVETTVDETGSLRSPSDLAIEKPGFEFGLWGTARTFGDGARSRAAHLTVAGKQKRIVLFGPRVYGGSGRRPEPGPPGVLSDVPLTHDRCFGGTDALTTPPAADPHNPIGRGFARDPARLAGTPCPEIELDGGAAGEHLPAHASFAGIPRDWSPRKERGGTYDNEWSRKRAPVAPVDLDPAFECWAPDDQRLDRAPDGGIDVEIAGLVKTDAGIVQRLRLPPYAAHHIVTIRGVEKRVVASPDSLLIDLDHNTVELTFRSARALPPKWEHVDSIVVMGSPLPDEILSKLDIQLAREGRLEEANE